jgi:hypothetical protein
MISGFSHSGSKYIVLTTGAVMRRQQEKDSFMKLNTITKIGENTVVANSDL